MLDHVLPISITGEGWTLKAELGTQVSGKGASGGQLQPPACHQDGLDGLRCQRRTSLEGNVKTTPGQKLTRRNLSNIWAWNRLQTRSTLKMSCHDSSRAMQDGNHSSSSGGGRWSHQNVPQQLGTNRNYKMPF